MIVKDLEHVRMRAEVIRKELAAWDGMFGGTIPSSLPLSLRRSVDGALTALMVLHDTAIDLRNAYAQGRADVKREEA